MAGKHMSFAEYKENWEKHPDKMKNNMDALKGYAEGLQKSVKHLKKRNKNAAKELNEYCEAAKRVTRPASEIKTKEEQQQWEKDQEKLEGLGKFAKENRVDLNLAQIAADEEEEAEALGDDDDGVDKMPQEPEQRKEYEGFQDFLRMLIDALCDALGHNYPELEYEQRQRKQMEREKRKHERELLKAEMQKEKERKESEKIYEEAKKELEDEEAKKTGSSNNDTPKDPKKTEDKNLSAEAFMEEEQKKAQQIQDPILREQYKKSINELNPKELGEKFNTVEKQMRDIVNEAEQSHQKNLNDLKNPKDLRMNATTDAQQKQNTSNTSLDRFLNDASKNGWNTSKNGERDFLEAVYKTPGLANVAHEIRSRKLQADYPAADKLRIADQAQTVVKDSKLNSKDKDLVFNSAAVVKDDSVKALTDNNKVNVQKNPEQTQEFLAQAKKNGWDPNGADDDFLTQFFQTKGLEKISERIAANPLSKENPSADKQLYALIATTGVKNGAVTSTEENKKAFEDANKRYSEAANKEKEIKKEKKEPEPVKEEKKPEQVELAALDQAPYIAQIQELNNSKDGKDHAEELRHCAASILAIDSIKKAAEKANIQEMPGVSQKMFEQQVSDLLQDKKFDDMMKKYGDLSQPEKARNFQKTIEQSSGKNLYGEYLQNGKKRRDIEHKNEERRMTYTKKKEQKLENEPLQLDNKKHRMTMGSK